MNKKKSFDLRLVNLFIGILVVIMLFLPVLIWNDSDASFTGLEVAFGKEFANLGRWASGEIAFNPLVLLAFLLPLAGASIPLFMKKGYLFSMMLDLAATLMLFMTPQWTTVTVSVLESTTEIDVDWTYGIGLILAIGLSVLGTALSLFKLYKESN
jgi:hypothetical protein